MNRREFITLLCGAALWPRVARAQQHSSPVIGFLNGSSAQEYSRQVVAFRRGLRETGYIEGHNVTIDYRWAEGHYKELPRLAQDLLQRQVAVIVANAPATPIAIAATASTPIVFVTGFDPVKSGLVSSINHPGGNVTGVNLLSGELVAKRLELLHELRPAAGRMAVLQNPSGPNVTQITAELRSAASVLGLQLQFLHAGDEGELASAFFDLSEKKPGGLLILGDVFFNGQSKHLAELALHHGLPAIYQYREFATAGGLMSYGGDNSEAYRLAGSYAGRILQGEKPADLPVQQSSKIELIINMKTAKALGLTVPITLLGRADEVIE